MVVLWGGKSTVCPMLQLWGQGTGDSACGLTSPRWFWELETVKLGASSAGGQGGKEAGHPTFPSFSLCLKL